MITLLSAFAGVLGSLLPEVLKFLNKKQDMKHELAMFDLQIKAAEKQQRYKMEEMSAQADIAESQALYKSAEVKMTGHTLIDGIIHLYQSSVRPTITYIFTAFYIAAKAGQYQLLVKSSEIGTFANVSKLFGDEDMALFAAIIGFWFGQRGVRYALERIGGAGEAIKPKI